MARLQDLQQQDPAMFKQVTSAMASQFQKASQFASASGNSSLATNLQDLAQQFRNASDSGTLPQLQSTQQPAGAIGQYGGHHHHGHHAHPARSSSSSDSDGTTT